MNIVEIVLLAIVTFFFAIDQFSLTEIVYRPIIACPIIGAILGDVNTGLVVGGTYELMMVGNMPVGGAQPPNAVLGSVVAMIFAVKAKMDINAANEANPKGITAVCNTSMAILGTLFAVIAILAYVGGTAASGALQSLSENASWFMGGLSAAGGMMRFVGFAVLLKIMLSNDLWGWLLGGFATALLFGNVEATASACLILVAFIGVAIALLDFKITSIETKAAQGGVSDGI